MNLLTRGEMKKNYQSQKESGHLNRDTYGKWKEQVPVNKEDNLVNI
jgi:hypothetical protein